MTSRNEAENPPADAAPEREAPTLESGLEPQPPDGPAETAIQAPQAPRIFISYRRSEGQWFVQTLYAHLAQDYEPDEVFLDARSIPPGRSFPDDLKLSVQAARVVLVVIGPRWEHPEDDRGQSRLNHRNDWVRREVEIALTRWQAEPHAIEVIPVLFERTAMPSKRSLPAGKLRGLPTLNAFAAVGPKEFESGYAVLRDRLDECLGTDPAERRRRWVYDDIARHIQHLTADQRLQSYLLLGRAPMILAPSPRRLARCLYRSGPAGLSKLHQILPLDARLESLLERLRDHWVADSAATGLREAWVGDKPMSVCAVVSEEPEFTPACLIQRAADAATSWPSKIVASSASQLDAATLVSQVHAWLRKRFFNQLHRRRLPDEENAEVTAFLLQKLYEDALAGRPLSVQLDELSASDTSLMRLLQTTFPFLRILAVTNASHGLISNAQAAHPVDDKLPILKLYPEQRPGEERAAADAYFGLKDALIEEDDVEGSER